MFWISKSDCPMQEHTAEMICRGSIAMSGTRVIFCSSNDGNTFICEQLVSGSLRALLVPQVHSMLRSEGLYWGWGSMWQGAKHALQPELPLPVPFCKQSLFFGSATDTSFIARVQELSDSRVNSVQILQVD